MKKLLIFLFTVISVAAFGQAGSLSQSVYRSRVNDSTSVTTPAGYGLLYYNNQRATPAWLYSNDQGATWHEFGTGSVGGSVTSVGVSAGTSGTDVNISGSPITSSGTITVNIPDAGASARGVVTTGSQTFAGAKTFSQVTVGNARWLTLGTNNLFLGNGAGNLSIGVGLENTAIGTNAGAALTTGNRHTFFGYNAGAAQVGGFNNSFFGNGAGDVTTGSGNTFIGKDAGGGNTTGGSSVMVGNAAGLVNNAGNQTLIGNAAGINATGNLGVAIGANAGQPITTGTLNTFIGTNAMGAALGKVSGSIGNNVGIGYNALFRANGSRNIGIGVETLSNNKGDNNTAIGDSAGDFLTFTTPNQRNVLIGSQAMVGQAADSTSGSDNTIIGTSAAVVLDGSENTIIGSMAATTLASGDGNVFIGYDIEPQSTTGSDQLSIQNAIFGTGNSSVGTTVSSGNIGIYNPAPTEKLDIAGNLKFSGALMPNNAPGTSGQLLQSAGSGSPPTWVSNVAGISKIINSSVTITGNVGTGEDVLYTYTVPAGQLASDKDQIVASITGRIGASGNNKQFRLKYGASTIFDSGALADVTGSYFNLEVQIYRTGAATQRCIVTWASDNAALDRKFTYTDTAETLSGTVVLQLTGEATSTNEALFQMGDVSYRPHE